MQSLAWGGGLTPQHPQPSDQFEDGEDRLKLKLRLRVDQSCALWPDGMGGAHGFCFHPQ